MWKRNLVEDIDFIPCHAGWVYDISTGKIEDLKVSEGTNVGGNPLE